MFYSCLVEVALEDGDSDTPTTVDGSDMISSVDGVVDASQGDSAELMTHENTSDNLPVKQNPHKRSLIWRYFDHLEGLDAARCRICMKKLKCGESGGTSNLRRHMSNRHPEVFSSLVAEGHRPHPPKTAMKSNCNTPTPQEKFEATEHKVFSGKLASIFFTEIHTRRKAYNNNYSLFIISHFNNI